jgi:RNA polymerase sigma factor (sigma-70 family)
MADKNSTWIPQALEQYEARLLRYAARLLGDNEAARDIVQETFLELCKTRRSRVEEQLTPWLFRVCRNRAFDLRRKEKRVQALSEEQSQNIESPEPSPQAAIETSQGAQALLGMVQKLPDNQKEIVFLRFQSGLSYKEISEVTG